jgi:hypothetical protein
MDNSRIPKKSTGWKIPWKKTCGKTTTEVGRPRLRWEDNMRRDSLLLLNVRDGQGIRISGGKILKRPRPDVCCRAIEE